MSPYCYQQKTIREQKLAVKRWFLGASCRVLICGLMIIFGFLFVWKTSSVSTKGYEMNEFEKQSQTLEQENERLELAVAETSSLKNIEEKIAQLGLVSADQVEYAALPGTAVAMK